MGLELLLVQRQFDTLAGHHRIQHRIRHFNGMQAFLCRSDQLRAVQNRRHEILLDADVLFAVAAADRNVDVPDGRNAERALRVLRIFVRWHFVARKRQAATFANQFAARSGDFEAVRSGSLASRRHEHARRAVRIFEHGRDVIFNFDVMVFADAADGGHSGGHAAQPLEQIQIVRALVQQNTAAFAAPRRTPAAGAVVGFAAEPRRDDPVRPLDLAEFALFDQLLDFNVVRIRPLIEHRGEDQFRMRLMGGDQPHGVRLVDGNRLLGQNMQTIVQGVDTDGRMEIMRRRDQNGINKAAANHLRTIRKSFDIRIFLQFRGIDVADGGQFATRNLPGLQMLDMARTHVTQTDDT